MKKKSRIRETPTLSTDADFRTDTNLKSLRDLSKKNKLFQKNLGGVQFFCHIHLNTCDNSPVGTDFSFLCWSETVSVTDIVTVTVTGSETVTGCYRCRRHRMHPVPAW